ncbi:hypothetical protein CGLO_10235 [Colletotrichum gloeosporioides Cg-14]|uniref:Uncharacterized protein n=1 Tax=Colletotrichum gloeosporioides (strain Cg-14) TaxID=1237896 RepID=T0LQ70_COLGC|nr:hypothetical protein CGLO_10235 [Colletotrichum gloeosporioides Cg-14]
MNANATVDVPCDEEKRESPSSNCPDMATVLPARSQGWHGMAWLPPPSLSIAFPKTVFRAISLVTGMLPRSPGPNSAQSEQQQQPSVPRAPGFSSPSRRSAAACFPVHLPTA